MEKLEEEVKLFEGMVKFMEKICISNEHVTMDDREVLSMARDNVNDVQREFSEVISSSSAMDVSLIVKDYRSKVEKELNDICNKVSDLNIKADIKDYVKPEDAVIDDVDGAAAPYIAYLERKKKLILESEDYELTLEFIYKLRVIARKEQVSEKDLGILLRGYIMIMRVYRDLSTTIDSDHSSSVWDIDVSLTISESRTKVENELNYMCNNMTDHTIMEDISQHLVGFKAGHLPKKLLPLNFADRRKRVSSQSGDGEFKSEADYAFGYPNHRKRIKKQAESKRNKRNHVIRK